jgi:hypothetical protein
MFLSGRHYVISTVASLPFFLFTVPAGALADKVNRQKLVCTINFGMAAKRCQNHGPVRLLVPLLEFNQFEFRALQW